MVVYFIWRAIRDARGFEVMQRVSVIVLNYNGAHLLPDCVESLLAQDYSHLEILVVDNASVDESERTIQKYPGVRWLGLPSNEGLGPGYNAGAKTARGNLLFFVNNDTRFEPDCVRHLVKAFQDDQVLAADPLQMDWNGSQVIHGAQRFRRGWRYLFRAVPLMEPYQDLKMSRETEVPWGCAGALMFERRKFEALGGFDPTFFLDYEDVDICWRGWLRGWKTLFVPAARLRHRVGESEDSLLRRHNPTLRTQPLLAINNRRRLSQLKNAQRFVLKNMPWSLALLALGVNLLQIAGAFLFGRFSQGLNRIKAAVLNSRELGQILAQRRQIQQGVSISRLALLKRRWE